MINSKIHNPIIKLAVIALIMVCPLSLLAQNDNEPSDMDYFAAAYNVKYDSLLNSYYFKKNHQNIQRKYHLGSDGSPKVDFGTVSDSVIYKRLLSLNTKIPLEYNPRVRGYVNMYLKKMNHSIDVMLSLSELYFPLFEEVLDKYGVPQEMKYLAIIESALNPNAVSRAGATGLWQFMYGTGKNYNLEINTFVDERRDPLKSTHAAARYLRDLHKIYDNWPLAIAAYNCGPGNVNKAIARSGGKYSFWEIYYYLPRETRGYIPAYIAAAYMMNFYSLHGLHPNKITIPTNNDTIVVHKEAAFSEISRFVNIPVEELKTLNPQYKLDIIPASEKGYSLRLPNSKLTTFIKFQDSIYSHTKDSVLAKALREWKSTKTITHTVRKKETINKIASQYGVSVANIKKWNHKKNNKVRAGERLIIYKSESKKDSVNESDSTLSEKKDAEKHTARPAPQRQTHPRLTDTTKADTTHSKVAADTLKISRPSNSIADKKKKEEKSGKIEKKQSSTYKVKAGETLYSIATKNNTTVNNIKKLNNLKSDNIRTGQTLKIR